MRWALLILGLLVLVIGAYVLYGTLVVNPRVVEELRTQPDGERAQRVALLTFPDGRTIPVNYLREGDQVFIGADGPWWRTFRDGDVPVQLLIQGATLSGSARTILDDRAYTEAVFERLRPAAPDWLPFWLNGYLVVIDLEAS